MLCNIKPVPFHESDKHIFAKIPGGVRTHGPPSGSAHATDVYVTVQIKLFVCMEEFDRCVSSFASFVLSLSYVLQGMGTKQTESKTVPRHKAFLSYVRLQFS